MFLVSSCVERTKHTECYYDTVTTYAKVVDLRPHPEGNGRVAVILRFEGSALAAEDQELGALKPQLFIDHDFLVRNNIEIGHKYEATVSELVKGDCKTKLTVAFSHGFE
ncbi:MAG: hypothetical protein Kow0075_17440 [Salibacteraceae bacterium]